jgi:hypothetical protein
MTISKLSSHALLAMQHRTIYANLESVRHVGRLTRDNKVGACDQFACAIVEELLINNEVEAEVPKIEILGNGGHAFVVVNRRDGAELNNIDTWQDAILVDVWTFNQGLLLEPAYWAKDFPPLRNWANAGLLEELFLFDVGDWMLIGV